MKAASYPQDIDVGCRKTRYGKGALMFVSVKEAAKILGCSTRTVMARCERQELPSYLEDGRRLVWAPKEDPLLKTMMGILERLEALEQRDTPSRFVEEFIEDSDPIEELSEPITIETPRQTLPGPRPAIENFPQGSLAEMAYGKYQPDWSLKPGVIVHPRHARALDQLPKLWPGSISSFEKAAGIPKGFISYARKGKREGPKSRRSWGRIAEALETLQNENTKSAA